VDEARRAVVGDISSAAGAHRAVADLLSVGTSAGGAQAKAVVGWAPGTGELRADTPGLPPEFEPWLLKFDVAPAASGRVEYAYWLMARAAGMDLAEARLLEESSGRAHFMTRRFDRLEGHKLHLQSFAALAALDFTLLATHSHAQLFVLVDRLGLDLDARREVFRRAVFNTLAANNDDHPKNTSFLCDQRGQWALAPAYDLTFAHDPSKPWLARRHLSVEGKHQGVTIQDLRVCGDRFGVPEFADVIGQVEDAVGRWPEHAGAAGVPAEQADGIGAELGRRRAGG
jgi:serine/threonine-protein kinase HipA